MTASSELDDARGPRYARLNNTAGMGPWCPSDIEIFTLSPMYIQVSRKVDVFCIYIQVIWRYIIIIRYIYFYTNPTTT